MRGPYTSEVSNKVTPRLKACAMTAMPASSSSGELYAPVSPMHPNPSLDTYMDGNWNQSAESIQSKHRATGLADNDRAEARPPQQDNSGRGERWEIKETSNPWVPSLTRGTGRAWVSMVALACEV